MKYGVAALAVSLLLAGQAGAADLSCDEAMARVDTFGRLPFSAKVETPPDWAIYVDGNCADECGFAEPEGASYWANSGYLLDKELWTGTDTPWPWGLKSDDGPKEVAAVLARLLPYEGRMTDRKGGPTYNLDILGCDVWIEVTFEGERGIKAVSLNSQP
ncbi:MAG: hypothetical protein JWR84_2625 [Caulobacter sp.]|nr:hypothetical protein [Caulobacter sp.]